MAKFKVKVLRTDTFLREMTVEAESGREASDILYRMIDNFEIGKLGYSLISASSGEEIVSIIEISKE